MTDDASAGGGAPPCCPLPPGVAPLAVAPAGDDDERLLTLSRRAQALSDPIRLRMLEVIVRAQGCCRPGGELAGPPNVTAAAGTGDGRRASAASPPAGVCVCELQSLQGLAQSKVSYHLRVLRDAGLVREQRRGKWSFYAIDEDAAEEFAAAVRRLLGR
jgi:ArsR family transcriptional regulator, arsenate/arsenite/antimonite-responsive transcriptional repressor